MIGIIIALLSVLLPLDHLDFSRHPRTRGRSLEPAPSNDHANRGDEP